MGCKNTTRMFLLANLYFVYLAMCKLMRKLCTVYVAIDAFYSMEMSLTKRKLTKMALTS